MSKTSRQREPAKAEEGGRLGLNCFGVGSNLVPFHLTVDQRAFFAKY